MQTSVTLTSKGQLAIPKGIRDSLHLRAGAKLGVTLDGSRIVLETGVPKSKRLADWLPQLQIKKKINTAALVAPVDGYNE